MEPINNLVGVVFATTFSVFMLLPILVFIESMILKWVKYSTLGNVSFESPITKLWKKYLSVAPYNGSFIERKNMEPLLILGYILLYLVLVGAYINVICVHNFSFLEATSKIFYFVSTVAAYLSPMLLILFGMALMTGVSRKIFKFKEEVEEKLKK